MHKTNRSHLDSQICTSSMRSTSRHVGTSRASDGCNAFVSLLHDSSFLAFLLLSIDMHLLTQQGAFTCLRLYPYSSFCMSPTSSAHVRALQRGCHDIQKHAPLHLFGVAYTRRHHECPTCDWKYFEQCKHSHYNTITIPLHGHPINFAFVLSKGNEYLCK